MGVFGSIAMGGMQRTFSLLAREVLRARTIAVVFWPLVVLSLVFHAGTDLLLPGIAGGLIASAEQVRTGRKRTPTPNYRIVVGGFGVATAVLGSVLFVLEAGFLRWIGAGTVLLGCWIVADTVTLDVPEESADVSYEFYHRVLDELEGSSEPLTSTDLAEACSIDDDRLDAALAVLLARGTVERCGDRYVSISDRLWPRVSVHRLWRRTTRPIRILRA